MYFAKSTTDTPFQCTYKLLNSYNRYYHLLVYQFIHDAVGNGDGGCHWSGYRRTVVTLLSPVLQPAARHLNKKLWVAFGRFNPPAPRVYTLIDTQ